jgi:hypothetical protein
MPNAEKQEEHVMQANLYAALAPVRRRQRLSLALRGLVLGLLAGAATGLVLGGGRLGLGWSIVWWQALTAVVAGPLVGGLIGLGWPRSWHAAAAAVDRHYRLKDRAVTALEFLKRPERTDMQVLQIEDALTHLRQAEAREVVPLRWPRALPGVAVALAGVFVLLLWPLRPGQVEASAPEPAPPHIVAVADRQQQSLSDLEDEARSEDLKEVQPLLEQLQKKIEEMKQAGVDDREALAKLSEMESAVQAQQGQYDTALIDGQLQSLGSAMMAARALEGAGKALQDNKLDKAAEELDKLDEPELDRKEQKAVEEKLKQVAKEMGDVGLGQLGSAVSDFADSVKGGKGKGKKASKTLAKEVRNQSRRKRITNLLEGLAANIREGKSELQSNSMVKGKMPYKSTSPSSTFGMETSGNVQGEKTNLLAQQNQVDITGDPGDGPSDTETTSSPEARQKGRRQYKEVYQKYRKMSEAVLDSEAIPLGHRQIIRHYFDLIRPRNADAPDKEAMERPRP